MSVELNGNTSLSRSLAIIPAYNEAHSIEFVVMQIRQSQPDIDVIVIDDGSTGQRKLPTEFVNIVADLENYFIVASANQNLMNPIGYLFDLGFFETSGG